MGKLVLILGGVRSGKSHFAQQLATELADDNVLFVATAEAGDDEMRDRIERHRQDRSPTWSTIEVTRRVGQTIAEQNRLPRAIIVDCMTLLVSNLLLQSPQSNEPGQAGLVDEEVASLLALCRDTTATVIIVSGEVGMGVVPDSELGRQFRDLLGRANQQIAEHATSIYLMIAGLAMDVRAGADSVQKAAARLTS